MSQKILSKMTNNRQISFPSKLSSTFCVSTIFLERELLSKMKLYWIREKKCEKFGKKEQRKSTGAELDDWRQREDWGRKMERACRDTINKSRA